jgi:hypothetical protein
MTDVQDNKSTRIISLTAAGTQIIAHGYHKRILIQENYTSAAGATTDLGKQAPTGADEVIVLKGTPAVFTAHGPNGSFYPGQVVGLVSVLDVAGPVEGAQTEDDEI